MEHTNFDWLTASVGTTIGAGLTYVTRILFDRKKLKAENKSAELDADTKAVELYERFASKLEPKIEALQAKIETLTDQVFALKEENHNLKIQNSAFKMENDKLRTELQSMHKQIEELNCKIK